MPGNNKLIQIWIDLPDAGYQETLQATVLLKSLYQIQEIPFISEQVNYLDVVLCKSTAKTPRLVMDIVKPSGYLTKHIMFAEHVSITKKSECIRPFLQNGAAYRRSGLRAFSISIPPEANAAKIEEYILELRQSGLLSDENHKSVGALEQTMRHLTYLMGQIPKLQNGRLMEAELDI